ncbi:MAG: hypothetical protein K6A92_07005 [Lachnospiraceae bacterium]|nr:hypothetical protein [Lachnospiraceae bacterium]
MLRLCENRKNTMVLRYAVPFYTALYDCERIKERTRENACYQRICHLFEKSCAFSPAQKETQESDAYEYIASSLLSDDPRHRNPGRSYAFDLSALPKEYLDEQGKMTFRFCYKAKEEGGQTKEITVRMSQMGVYYFRTNVGILWYELEPGAAGEELTLEELVYFQNQCKELHRANGAQVLLRKENNKNVKYIPGKLFASILEDLFSLDVQDKEIPYGEGKLAFHFFDPSFSREKKDAQGNVTMPSREYPDKAILFTYLLLDGDSEDAIDDLEKTAYYFSSGYTSRYHISQITRARMYEPFEGVRWFATRDGAGYYALRTEDNRMFFQNNLAGKIRVDYFLFFILALHQSYALNNYQRRITAELSANPNSYLNESASAQKMEHLLAEINVFAMKSIYMSVSHVQHQNDFFEYLQKNLEIQEDMESLSLGIESLTELSRLQREDSEKENEKKINTILGIISLLTIVSALTDGFAIIQNYQQLLLDESLQANGLFFRLLELIRRDMPFSVWAILLHVGLIVLMIYSIVTLLRIGRRKSRRSNGRS